MVSWCSLPCPKGSYAHREEFPGRSSHPGNALSYTRNPSSPTACVLWPDLGAHLHWYSSFMAASPYLPTGTESSHWRQDPKPVKSALCVLYLLLQNPHPHTHTAKRPDNDSHGNSRHVLFSSLPIPCLFAPQGSLTRAGLPLQKSPCLCTVLSSRSLTYLHTVQHTHSTCEETKIQ